MSPAVVATSSSSPNQISGFTGHRLTHLTPSSSSRGAHEQIAAGASEPHQKRRRLQPPTAEEPPQWAYDDVFANCLQTQVFPHVNREVAKLPSELVDTKSIGRKVVEIITSSVTDFREAYKRGNGLLSPRFERRLAVLASAESQRLAQRPEYHLRPSRVESPVPIPTFPVPGSKPRAVPRSALPQLAPATPRYSTSPIPLPVLPGLPVSTPLRQESIPGLVSSPIVINSDSDDPSDPYPNLRGSAVGPSSDLATNGGPPKPKSPQKPEPPPVVSRPTPERLASSPIPLGRSRNQSGELPERENRIQRAPKIENAVGAEPESQSLNTPPSLSSAVSHPEVRRPIQIPLKDDLSFGAQTNSRWLSLRHQPYISAAERELVVRGVQGPVESDHRGFQGSEPAVFHVDFTDFELRKIRSAVREYLRVTTKKKRDLRKDLSSLLRKRRDVFAQIAEELERQNLFPHRTRQDFVNLFLDINRHKTSREPRLLSLGKDENDAPAFARASRVSALLFRREISGQRGLRSMRRLVNFPNEFKVCREDELTLRAEWTNCAGDIATIVWVSNDSFICGTTEHSDAHNQQYNKAGNLILGSCGSGILQAYPEHRIVRPIVQNGENSTEAMRQTQDPWLYTSVVSSDYDVAHNRAFTSGFDRTVKIWEVKTGELAAEPSSMRLLGQWAHGGNVNFVAASKHESGMVATASDVAANAVRIYTIDDANLAASSYRSYSCSRVTDAEGNTVSTEKWAYFPATMQWGISKGVRHLLLVGYSPRSRTGDDTDIPEDRLCSGELCLWDGLTGERWRLTSATTQNVFEVLWHPTQDSFIAATSPLGLDVDYRVRTQIRIFRPSDNHEYGGKAFTPVKTLDCFAADINELTIMPNSFTYCYVTAGCTDGNTYVWDTSQGDKPLHILRHGDCIEELRGDREREDVGVKFTAWGTTLDRFYTGSSDGVVKVWNVRCLDRPLIRTLLEVPAQVSCGMFSPDRTKLLIGDASGRVFLLSIDEAGTKSAEYTIITFPGSVGVKKIRRPIPILQHKEPPPPEYDAAGKPFVVENGTSRGKSYLQTGQLQRHPNPTVGVVQGPRYAETGLYCTEAHFNNDPSAPLLASWEAKQQEPTKAFPGRRRSQFIAIRQVKEQENLPPKHAANLAQDLDIEGLPLETKLELSAAGADLSPAEDYDFAYDEAWSDNEL